MHMAQVPQRYLPQPTRVPARRQPGGRRQTTKFMRQLRRERDSPIVRTVETEAEAELAVEKGAE